MSEAQMETLYCTVGEHDFQRQKQRGRKPNVCPECKAKQDAELEQERQSNGGDRRTRRTFKNVYSLAEGEVQEGEMALYLNSTAWSTLERQLAYAKEYKVLSIDREAGTAVVQNGKEAVSTLLHKLNCFDVERVAIEDLEEENLEEEEVGDE